RQDRLAIVIEFVAGADGVVKRSDVYGALVRNQARLAYSAVGAWLSGEGPLPPAAAAVTGMDAQLRMQDGVAQALSRVRHERGALEVGTTDVQHVFAGDGLEDVRTGSP